MCDGEICEPVTQPRSEGGGGGGGPSGAAEQELRVTYIDKQPGEMHLTNGGTTETPIPVQVDPLQVAHWAVEDVTSWANQSDHFSRSLIECLRLEAVDGEVLLSLTEDDVRDMRYRLGYKLTFGELKKFWIAVLRLQLLVKNSAADSVLLGIESHGAHCAYVPLAATTAGPPSTSTCPCPLPECPSTVSDCETYLRLGGRYVAPEYFKTAMSLAYSFVVTWITSFVMVIVHERVPDMKRYPPLPDIFLDNVPHIPWAFNMCEITGSLLFTIWLVVLIFHKYRMVLLRRFFALAGTVFLLRCVTMLITSLSVPGTHLQCNQKDFAIDDPNVDMVGALIIRMTRAYRIWSGLGMSIQGVRTCGDYMFSGHTVALTLLNFFITEYTPRNLYFLHTLTWLLNMFGIFFILAAHEHYSIDVFVAFYITSRLFLYYHTLANNRALMQSDSKRTRVWFPMYSYFESRVDGMVPNEFDTPGSLINGIIDQIFWAKDQVIVTIKRLWVDSHSPLSTKSSIQIFGADSEEFVHNTSNFYSPRPSTTDGVNHAAASSATATPAPGSPKRKNVRDVNIDPFSRATIVAPSDASTSQTPAKSTPLKQKKVL
ncbi:hypothetical protein KR054_001279 [Drosophila jambulina]|nr:hypothetical protein KR054_001279 [Drosophila jambulina]